MTTEALSMIVCSQCSAEFPATFRGESCTRCGNKLPPRTRRLSGFGLPTYGAANAANATPSGPPSSLSTSGAGGLSKPYRGDSSSDDRWDLPDAPSSPKAPEPSVFRAPTQPRSFGRPRVGGDTPTSQPGFRTTMSIGVEEVQARLAALRAAKEAQAPRPQGAHEAPTRPVNTRRLLSADMPEAIPAPPGTRPIETAFDMAKEKPQEQPLSSAGRLPASGSMPHKQTFVGAAAPSSQGLGAQAAPRRFRSTATFDPRVEPMTPPMPNPVAPTVPRFSDFDEEDIATRRIQTGPRVSGVPVAPQPRTPAGVAPPESLFEPDGSPSEELDRPDPYAATVLAPVPLSNPEPPEPDAPAARRPSPPEARVSDAPSDVAAPADPTVRTRLSQPHAPTKAQGTKASAAVVGPPVLASTILREDLVPHEPGSDRLRMAVALAGAALVIAVPFSGLRGLSTVGVWLACGLLSLAAGIGPLGYSLRALVTVLVALPCLAWELLAVSPLSRLGAALTAGVLAALPTALLFRSDFRASRRARVFIALGVLVGLGWTLAPGAGGALTPLGGSWFSDHLGALILSPLLLLSMLGFMGSNTTAGCKIWASMVVVWGAWLPSLALVNTELRVEALRSVLGHMMATGSLAALVAVSMASTLAVYLRPSEPRSVLTPED